MTETARNEQALVDRIVSLVNNRHRLIVGIAGPPGSGKSTLTASLHETLQKTGAGPACVVPMDGFHLDNTVLEMRNLLPRKGAPQTFDADGFVHAIQRIRAADGDVVVPVFDRALDLARAGAEVVSKDERIILVEGNYLLLDAEPWARLKPLFDLMIFLAVPEEVLRARLVQRWLDHDHTPREAEARAMSNDMPNARLVIDGSASADVVYEAV